MWIPSLLAITLALISVSVVALPDALTRQCSAINLLTTTAEELSYTLAAGDVSSVGVIRLYLDHIKKYDVHLNAMIQLAPKSSVLDIAASLDYERKMGKIRGPLHGIPVIVKDSIATDPALGMETTAGTYALSGSRVSGDHPAVARLRKAGAIILGKANMSVWSYFRANFGSIPSGWSPRGGQTISAYSLSADACGSSTGSAVSVSAGFSPLALAAETDGSIICPGNRAALYAIKPTVGLTEAGGGLLSIGGAVPVARSMDSVGVMAKGVWDLVAAMDVMVDDYDAGRKSWGYWDAVEMGRKDLWSGLRIGIGSRKVYFDPEIVGSNIVEACDDAVQRLRSMGAVLVEVDMPGLEVVLTSLLVRLLLPTHSLLTDAGTEFKEDLEQYLSTLTGTSLHNLSDVVEYNNVHSATEMPENHCCQENFLEALTTSPDSEEYRAAKENARTNSQELGIDYALNLFNVSAILVPADGPSSAMTALAGYPIATAPLGYLQDEERPFGVAFFTTAGKEDVLLRILAAWEKTFHARRTPDISRLELVDVNLEL
ncbi:amidase signature domain-containing protein [Trichophaea hybrida]|nr:amidase signature domain-containing protein [Trichophaea hybrida]